MGGVVRPFGFTHGSPLSRERHPLSIRIIAVQWSPDGQHTSLDAVDFRQHTNLCSDQTCRAGGRDNSVVRCWYVLSGEDESGKVGRWDRLQGATFDYSMFIRRRNQDCDSESIQKRCE